MSIANKPNEYMEQEIVRSSKNVEEMHLDDARRIKVLSPGMLVFKRFIRNKLAVVGLAILLFMFSFSFLGPLFSPSGQIEVFKGVGNSQNPCFDENILPLDPPRES